jgi:hypothetical protein
MLKFKEITKNFSKELVETQELFAASGLSTITEEIQ